MKVMSKDKEKISIGRYIYAVLIVILAVLAGLSVGLIGWMFKTWPYLSADELLYQLTAPIEGTNQDMVMEAVLFCLPFMIIGLILVVVLFLLLRKRKSWIFWLLMSLILAVSLGGIAVPIYYAWQRLELTDYFESQEKATYFIDDNYVFPSNVELTFPEEKRNLIYIFLESMETTYADKENGGAYNVNYIPELTELAKTYEDFSGTDPNLNGGYVTTCASWTIAAMFAHSSGLPLKIPFDGNAMDTQSEFLPGVETIGDILKEEGYNQTLLIGSDATFGGRRLFYSDHGDFEIHDYLYALESGRLPEGYHEWWGQRDSKLFEFAKEELLTLSAEDSPFNLTMLTVDTHFEDGFVCDLCSDEFGDDQYGNVMACSSRQVTEFITWVQEQDFYENTTIVVVGDHLTMDADFCADVDEDYDRKVYTAIINGGAEIADPTKERQFTTLDLFPTTLASLGVSIEGERLGLGTNLYSAEPTLLETYGFEELQAGLRGKSELVEYFLKDIDVSKTEIETETSTE